MLVDPFMRVSVVMFIGDKRLSMSFGGSLWTEWSQHMGIQRQAQAKGSSDRVQLLPDTAWVCQQCCVGPHMCPLAPQRLVNLDGWAQQKAWHSLLLQHLLCWCLANSRREQAPKNVSFRAVAGRDCSCWFVRESLACQHIGNPKVTDVQLKGT